MAITKGTPPGREPDPRRYRGGERDPEYRRDRTTYDEAAAAYDDAQRGSVRAHTQSKKGGGKGMHGEEGEKMGRQSGAIGKMHAETGASPVKSLHASTLKDLFPNI